MRILILIITLMSCSGVTSQWWNETRKIEYSLYELEVRDSLFLLDLDTIFKVPCVSFENKENKYLYVSFEQPTTDNNMEVYVELLYIPCEIDDHYGYFYHKGYIFIISGYVPELLLKKRSNKRKFSYQIKGITPTESFPYWLFDYNNKRLQLLEYHCWEKRKQGD